jgi:long-chain fatty acid transport protein
LGASYRSKMEHDLDGRVFVGGLLGPLAPANRDTKGSAAFTTPWIATLGARWQATDKLALNAQVQRIGWGEFKSIDVSCVLRPSHPAAGTVILPERQAS